jgi:signal transduction histidine kinase
MNPDMDVVAEALARAEVAEERLRSQTLLRAEAEHRLRTSLTVITGWATTLDERWDQLGDDRRRTAVGIIRRASEDLSEEATRLLEDARTELLNLDADPVRLDLDAVLAVTTATFDGMSPGHVVEHVPSDGPVPVDADPAALQQVLGHLIENAVKYSPPGTRVTVGARSAGDEVVLEVSDEGLGVPEGIDLFAPFLRGAEAEHLPGVGLGLHIVRNLCRSMGGEVTTRRNAGQGSTFTVHLPAAG